MILKHEEPSTFTFHKSFSAYLKGSELKESKVLSSTFLVKCFHTLSFDFKLKGFNFSHYASHYVEELKRCLLFKRLLLKCQAHSPLILV